MNDFNNLLKKSAIKVMYMTCRMSPPVVYFIYTKNIIVMIGQFIYTMVGNNECI